MSKTTARKGNVVRSTNAEFILSALEDWFANHPTIPQQVGAVKASKLARPYLR